MNNKIVEIAASVLKLTTEETIKHYKEIPEENAYYFWNPVRGGLSVIVNSNGEKLGATSSVPYKKHLNAFKEGKRN